MSGTLGPDRVARVRDLLHGTDWRDVTQEQLAQAAGVSRMTLHRRGITKDDVLLEIGELLEAEHRDAALPALAGPGNARERLRAALAAVCDVDERYLGVIEGLSDRLGRVFHERGDGAVLTRAPFTEALRLLLETGATDGSIRVDDPAETATLLFNAAGWTYRHMRTGHRWPAEKARDAVVSLLVDGLPS